VELLCETGDNPVRKMGELRKRWDDRLSVENLRLSERYVKGEIYVLVCFMVPGDPVKRCALSWLLDLGRGGKGDRLLGDRLGWQVEQASEHVIHPLGIDFEPDFVGDHDGRYEQSVLVDNVKLMESPEVVVPSAVWLDEAYRVYRGLGDALSFSSKAGLVFSKTLADREVDLAQVNAGIGVSGEGVGEKIQGGSEVVGGIADKQTHSAGTGVNLSRK
jgi:hypothetical protein